MNGGRHYTWRIGQVVNNLSSINLVFPKMKGVILWIFPGFIPDFKVRGNRIK